MTNSYSVQMSLCISETIQFSHHNLSKLYIQTGKTQSDCTDVQADLSLSCWLMS